MRIEGRARGYDEVGRIVSVGAYDSGPITVVTSLFGEFAGLYRGAEGELRERPDALSELEPASALSRSAAAGPVEG